MASVWMGDAASDSDQMEEEWDESTATVIVEPPKSSTAAPPKSSDAAPPKSTTAASGPSHVASASSAPEDEGQQNSKSPTCWIKAAAARSAGKAKAKAETLAKPKGVAHRILSKQARDSVSKPRSADKTKRAARGSAQTFAGRRPPKDPQLCEAFHTIRQGFYDEKSKRKAEKRTMSVGQELFLLKMKDFMEKDKSTDSTQVKFQKAIAAWRAEGTL
ncbi:unnamed protein product [Symbiodinium sp. CCMP2592]|nr:unnamed protein product [Symbiodinium sp. CCMP2592]